MQLDVLTKFLGFIVYQGKPHGFMIVNGSLNHQDFADDAYNGMITFFRRNL
jgi:hypothetical protein